MEGQRTLSRDGASHFMSSHETQVLHTSTVPHTSQPAADLFHISRYPDGRTKVIWELDAPRQIPASPGFVVVTQLRSPTFKTGDSQEWFLKCSRYKPAAAISVYIQKSKPELPQQEILMKKEYKATVTLRVYENHKELDRYSRLMTFSVVHPCIGYQRALPINDEDSTANAVEVVIAPSENGERSREETQFVGLQNEGNSCYINALLQTLYHIPSFRQTVFSIPLEQRDSVAFRLQKVFYDLMKNHDRVATLQLMKSLGVSDEHTQEDVHEFCLSFYNQLEEAMKGSLTSYLSELFVGETETTYRCTNVPYTTDPRLETFRELQLPVFDSYSIEQSLRRLCSEEMKGENCIDAEHFGKQEAIRQMRFKRLPPVLQFFLKRFEYRDGEINKINDRFEFPETLDMSKYLCQPGEAEYELFSILVHQGRSSAGHYFAFIKTNLSEWFKFNDHSVDKVETDQVWMSSFGGHVPDFKVSTSGVEKTLIDNDMSAYMLCYIRTKDKRDILKPYVNLDPKLERLLSENYVERQVVVAPTREFELRYVAFTNLKGWKGPGVFYRGEKPLIPNDMTISTMSVPSNYTAKDLLSKLRKDYSELKARLWLFYPVVSDWQFRPLRPDTVLSQPLNDEKLTQVLYIETERNLPIAVKAARSAEIDDTDTQPEEPISAPLAWENSTLVFIKVYECRWGQGDLCLSSAVNLNEGGEITVDAIKQYILAEPNYPRELMANDLYVEHCTSVAGREDCELVSKPFISTKKRQDAVQVVSGDALILDVTLDKSEYVAPDVYVKRLVHYTTVSFAPVPLTETKDLLVDLEKIPNKRVQFQEEIMRNSSLREVLELLQRRLAQELTELNDVQVGVYTYERAAKGYVCCPRPMNVADVTKNLPLEKLLQKGKVLYGVQKPRTRAVDDIEVSVYYVDSRQSFNQKPLVRTLPGDCQVQNLLQAVRSEVEAIWREERGESLPQALTLYEHDGKHFAYTKKLTPHALIKDTLQRGSFLSVKVPLASENPEEKRVNCIVFSQTTNKYTFPKYVMVSVVSRQQVATYEDVKHLVGSLFQTVEKVEITSLRTLNDRQLLETLNSVFLRSYTPDDVQLYVTIN